MVALIPARAGSKRVPGKNTRILGLKPLIAWTIEAAKTSGVFDNIIVCSDDDACWANAADQGVQYFERDIVSDSQPDVKWVREVIDGTPPFDAFAILRPTSPFRTAGTIRRAYGQFTALGGEFGSLRAVERWYGPHPAKMWYLRDDRIDPVDEHSTPLAPWHSSPTQVLPTVVRQNASLEMARTACVTVGGTISGDNVAPFFTYDDEGFDINTEADWTRAEQIVASRQVSA